VLYSIKTKKVEEHFQHAAWVNEGKKSLVVFLGMNIEYITKMIKYQEVSSIWTAKSDEISLAGFVIEPASTTVTITMSSLPKFLVVRGTCQISRMIRIQSHFWPSNRYLHF